MQGRRGVAIRRARRRHRNGSWRLDGRELGLVGHSHLRSGSRFDACMHARVVAEISGLVEYADESSDGGDRGRDPIKQARHHLPKPGFVAIRHPSRL
jgi:hypothetical protein